MDCPDDKQLGDYLRGALGGEEAARIERHVRDCRACGLERSMTASASALVPPPPGGAAAPEPSPTPGDTTTAVAVGHRPAHFPKVGARYEIVERIARGGMGEVYRARDRELARTVALKILRPGAAGHAEFLNHLRREVSLASAITHPNVLRVFDLGQHEELRFLSMQLVDGEDLAAVIKRAGRLPIARAIRLFRQVADGTAAAHDSGVLHRDLKPQNILVDAQDHVYVADFGLARPLYGPPSGLGQIVGTPAYMSPEQARGQDLDSRSDLYSLGVILFELLTGRLPFRGPTQGAASEFRLNASPPAVRSLAPHVSPDLERVVARCLRADPSQRYDSVRKLLDDLEPAHEPARHGAAGVANAAPTRSAQPAAATEAPAALPVRVGDVVDGKYRVEREIGTGGMGVVLAARHLKLGEPVALKFVRWEQAGDPDLAERLMREARATFRLRSEHSVRFMDVGQLPSGPIYVVTELLEGEDFRAVLKARGRLPEREAVSYALQVCDALEDAHALGIVHRDLKPPNLFLAKQPRGTTIVKVLDFGLSKLDPERFDAAPLTDRHKALGTPRYMAPEQWRPGGAVDARADIWALGMILYELLTGAVPNKGRPTAERYALLLAGAIESPRTVRPELTENVARVVMRCLRADPDGRWRSARRLASALRQARPDVGRQAVVTVTHSAVTAVDVEAHQRARLGEPPAPSDWEEPTEVRPPEFEASDVVPTQALPAATPRALPPVPPTARSFEAQPDLTGLAGRAVAPGHVPETPPRATVAAPWWPTGPAVPARDAVDASRRALQAPTVHPAAKVAPATGSTALVAVACVCTLAGLVAVVLIAAHLLSQPGIPR
jgi:serine/threonine-protein kinase